MKKEGFTFIELLIAMAVIATLLATAIVGYTAAQKTGRDTQRKQNMHQYRTALEQFFAQNGRYPFMNPPDNGLTSLLPDYMSDLLADPLPSSVTPPLTYVAETDAGSFTYILYTNLEVGGYWVTCSSAAGGGKVGKLDSAPGGGWTESCPL